MADGDKIVVLDRKIFEKADQGFQNLGAAHLGLAQKVHEVRHLFGNGRFPNQDIIEVMQFLPRYPVRNILQLSWECWASYT